ncbi:MAG: N-acetyltransferase [Candidatus Ratteibacteria bacterium]|jgi:amino-acid N-acetyltransferase
MTNPKMKITTRKAKLVDVKAIHNLINTAAVKGAVVPRSLSEIYESIRDFLVAEENKKVVGCCGLHIAWEDLAEVRSLVVLPPQQKKGVGAKLLQATLKEAKRLALPKIFALTSQPEFFQKYGFERISRKSLPHKIWGDCLKCPKFPKCDEVALWKKLS